MRLSTDQIQAVRYAANATFGQGTEVWLFGSRVDDAKKGGDIDLLVRPTSTAADQPFAKRVKMLTMLERLLGERKIDLVIELPATSVPSLQSPTLPASGFNEEHTRATCIATNSNSVPRPRRGIV